MSYSFYTSVHSYGKALLVRGIENGQRFQRKVRYQPRLFVPTEDTTEEWRTLDGEPLEVWNFDDMKAARDFIKEYEEVPNFHIYGNTRFQYVWIYEQYPEIIDYDTNLIRIGNIDIEVESDDGFPDPKTAEKRVISITIKYGDTFFVFGLGDYKQHRSDVKYMKCDSELALLHKFLTLWEKIDVDIVTGWNCAFFDIPYLVNRITNVLGEAEAKRLSPWKLLSERTTTIMGKTQQAFDLTGIAILDYMEMFKKYEKQQESYRLDHIGNVVLGRKKLDYSEYANLTELYKKNHQKFIEYNIDDVELVDLISKEKQLIEQVLAIAYDAHVNYNDVFTQVRMWDVIIHNYLADHKIAIPQPSHSDKDTAYAGAYVKEPIPGMYEWVVSYDLASMYPHLIMQYNLGPETLIEGEKADIEVEDVLKQDKQIMNAHKKAKSLNASLAANGFLFENSNKSFLNDLMDKMYKDRSKYKKMMIEKQKEYEETQDPEAQRLAGRYNNMQAAKKVQLNSAYGAIGNQYFRFFDIRIATAITMSGQLSIRWIEQEVNNYLNEEMGTNIDYIIASDTDSIYVNMKPIVDQHFSDYTKAEIVDKVDEFSENYIVPFMERSYRKLAKIMNAYEQKMEMKREAIADRGIWQAKKRYILNLHDNEGVRYHDPKLKMMGIETVKSSTPGVCREALTEALKLIMVGTEQEVQDYIEEFEKKFKQYPMEDISFPRGVNGVTKYSDKEGVYKKGTPIHVKGALMYNYMIDKCDIKSYPKIQDGEKIKFCYLKEPNPLGVNCISILNALPKDMGLDKYIDYDAQFQKAFIDPLQSIMDKIGWKAIPISTLEDFFGD
ncbi:DNA polymerase domain-containing protein [Methanohalobium sp.]|uniref:DNA polymerase domain-containing protein n=1 Tax=Methanohalobium sp. TaxID=2837493 RepID=UPI0025DDBB10|nr:DNA polymerase domain-containing protein [Methanohalobium sp.]